MAVKKNCVATGSDFAHAGVQPDIEVVRSKIMNDLELSRSTEVRLPLLGLLRPISALSENSLHDCGCTAVRAPDRTVFVRPTVGASAEE